MAMWNELQVKLHTRASMGGWSNGPAREERLCNFRIRSSAFPVQSKVSIRSIEAFLKISLTQL
jgi:hypothetical protein